MNLSQIPILQYMKLALAYAHVFLSYEHVVIDVLTQSHCRDAQIAPFVYTAPESQPSDYDGVDCDDVVAPISSSNNNTKCKNWSELGLTECKKCAGMGEVTNK